MSQNWSTQDSPDEALSFSQLAEMLSQGLVTETTWVVSRHSQTQQQIFNIPGLEHAAKKLNQGRAPKGFQSVAISSNNSQTPQSKRVKELKNRKRSTGSALAAVSKLVFRTKPNVSLVLISVTMLVCSIGCWNYSNSELMRFPRPAGTPEVRVLPLLGDVPKTDFWVVQCCLVLAAIAAFEMSILRGQRSNPTDRAGY